MPTAKTITTQRAHRECAYELSSFAASPLDELADIFAAAGDANDPDKLFRLFVAHVEYATPRLPKLRTPAQAWRPISNPPAMTRSSAIPVLLKAIFDFYFRDDLYGHWINSDPIILSSGSFDEAVFGLPESLKDCIRFALTQNWYGYSDSLGRTSSREALALMETARFEGCSTVDPHEVVITLGGTAAVASITDFLAEHFSSRRKALCCTPNYPPLVAAMARRFSIELVPAAIVDGHSDISELIACAKTGVSMILLQTVTNPWGLRVTEDQLTLLIKNVPSDCYIVLDECHDAFGPAISLSSARRAKNVISVRSLSKRWATPGLKVGWLVAARDFTDAFYVHASTTYGGPPSFFYLLLEMFGLFETARLTGELGIREALGRLSPAYGLTQATLQAGFDEYVTSANTFAGHVRHCRELAVDALTNAGFEVLPPQYSINLLTRIGEESSYVLYRRLVSEAGVSVYPGLLAFAGGPGLVRISPCISIPALEEGLHRIDRWSRGRGIT